MIPVLVYKRNIGEILAFHPEHPECIKSAAYSPKQGNNYHIPARLHGSCPLLNVFRPGNFLNDYGGAFRVKAVLLKRYSASRSPPDAPPTPLFFVK